MHVLNFEGHGGLAIPAGAFSLEMFRHSVLNYMNENNIDSANIFGYSMGGYVAISLAGEYSERVTGIMTLATKFDWNKITAESERKMLDPTTLLNKVPKFAETLKQRHAPQNWENVVLKTGEFISSLGTYPLLEDDFRKVKCKVRIMVGDHDKMVSVTESQDTYRRFNSGSLVVLPDTSHPFEAVDEKRLMYEIQSFFTA